MGMTEMFHTPGEDEKKKIEGLGITREDYTKAINECIFGEEEPASKDLEEEIKKMQMHYNQYAPLYASDIEHIARHFASWQKNRDQFQIDMAHDSGYMEGQDYAREQMMKDEKWLQDNHKKIYNNGWDEGFGDGRDSMEEDMMKDVVEIPLHKWLPALLYDKMSEKGFKDGDMVKLIIVKED